MLITDYSVEGTGDSRTISAELEWTFPLDHIEIVSGDGETVDTQVVSATESSAFRTRRFEIPFDATGKTWVRMAAWDSAGNVGFVQPVWLTEPSATN